MKHLPDLFSENWGLSRLHRQIDRLFNQMLEPVEFGEREIQALQPSLDVEELGDHYLLSLDLPGVKKDDINVELRSHQLIISAERKDERKRKKGGAFHLERFYGTFYRSIPLPESLKAEDIQCDYKDGVLKIAVPKREELAQAKRIEIGEGKPGFFERLTQTELERKEEERGKKEQVA